MKQNTIISAVAVVAISTSQLTLAQTQLPINSDNLSFFEEPLAKEIGGFTFLLNGLIDFSVNRDLDNDENEEQVGGLFQISAERQLANALTIGGSYIGNEDDGYDGDAALFVRGVWGRLSVGNVTNLTREATRRMRGVGNAELAFDDTYGEFEDKGVAYSLRLSQMTVNAMVDEDGNFDTGATFDRPLGDKDYRFTARFSDNEFETDAGETLDSKGIKLLGELIYGSWLMDAGIGYERLKGAGISADRYYLSTGVNYKVGRWTTSLEGHYGSVDGESERSTALGLRYDIARGFSANLGVNYIDAAVNVDEIQLQDEDTTEAIFSLRYEF